MDFVAHLVAEFDRRRAANRRYSLRRFAQSLGTTHTSLSRLCRRTQRPRPKTIDALGRRLGLTPPGIAAAVRSAGVDRLLDAAAAPGFRADARWLAARGNLPIDDLQIALQEALRTRRLSMTAHDVWRTEK